MPWKDPQYRVMSEGAAAKVLSRLRCRSKYWHAFFLISGELGLRVSETASLRWETAQKKEERVGVETLKKRPPKNAPAGWKPGLDWLPLTKAAVEALDALAGKGGWPAKGWIFPSPRRPQFPVTRRAAAYALKEALREAKLSPKYVPHAFRHLLGMRCVKAGLSIPQAQKMLRHSNPRNTALYFSLPFGEEAAEVLREFQKKLGGKKES